MLHCLLSLASRLHQLPGEQPGGALFSKIVVILCQVSRHDQLPEEQPRCALFSKIVMILCCLRCPGIIGYLKNDPGVLCSVRL